MGYSKRTWVCPYFKWDERTKIHCECGVLCFINNKELGEYAEEYCSDYQWGSCTLARNRNRHYEKQNAQKNPSTAVRRSPSL